MAIGGGARRVAQRGRAAERTAWSLPRRKAAGAARGLREAALSVLAPRRRCLAAAVAQFGVAVDAQDDLTDRYGLHRHSQLLQLYPRQEGARGGEGDLLQADDSDFGGGSNDGGSANSTGTSAMGLGAAAAAAGGGGEAATR